MNALAQNDIPSDEQMERRIKRIKKRLKEIDATKLSNQAIIEYCDIFSWLIAWCLRYKQNDANMNEFELLIKELEQLKEKAEKQKSWFEIEIN